MKDLFMASFIMFSLVGMVFYALIQSSKQYDSVYQSNDSMIALHKLDIEE